MPYADPEKRKAYQREYSRQRRSKLEGLEATMDAGQLEQAQAQALSLELRGPSRRAKPGGRLRTGG